MTFQKRKMLEEFEFTLEKVKKFQILPNENFFLAIFSFSEFVIQDFDRVKQYLHDMRNYSKVTFGTYNLLLKTYFKKEDQRAALEVLDMLYADNFRINPTLSFLFKKLAKSKESEYSKPLLEKSSLEYPISSRE